MGVDLINCNHHVYLVKLIDNLDNCFTSVPHHLCHIFRKRKKKVPGGREQLQHVIRARGSSVVFQP